MNCSKNLVFFVFCHLYFSISLRFWSVFADGQAILLFEVHRNARLYSFHRFALLFDRFYKTCPTYLVGYFFFSSSCKDSCFPLWLCLGLSHDFCLILLKKWIQLRNPARNKTNLVMAHNASQLHFPALFASSCYKHKRLAGLPPPHPPL